MIYTEDIVREMKEFKDVLNDKVLNDVLSLLQKPEFEKFTLRDYLSIVRIIFENTLEDRDDFSKKLFLKWIDDIKIIESPENIYFSESHLSINELIRNGHLVIDNGYISHIDSRFRGEIVFPKDVCGVRFNDTEENHITDIVFQGKVRFWTGSFKNFRNLESMTFYDKFSFKIEEMFKYATNLKVIYVSKDLKRYYEHLDKYLGYRVEVVFI